MGLAADGIDHGIDAGNNLLKALGVRVDYVGRTEASDVLGIASACYRKYPRARPDRELNRIGAYVARCTVHQHRLALCDLRSLEEHLPGRNRNYGNRRRRNKV